MFRGEPVKKVTAFFLFVLLGLVLSVPTIAQAGRRNPAQHKATKNSQKAYKKTLKQQKKSQKKNMKSQKKATKSWKKQHSSGH
jgi:outer membrane lipoprotein-sorting protein